MKNGRNPNDGDGLLDAVLVDAEWQALDGALKGEALAVIGTVRRQRRLRLAMAQMASAAAVLLAAVCWLRSPEDHGRAPATGALGPSARPDTGDIFVTEEQMLAMFPARSCAVVEVDGQKELVFFDAQDARDGFVVNAQ